MIFHVADLRVSKFDPYLFASSLKETCCSHVRVLIEYQTMLFDYFFTDIMQSSSVENGKLILVFMVLFIPCCYNTFQLTNFHATVITQGYKICISNEQI